MTWRAVVDASVALSWVLPGEAYGLTAPLRKRALENPNPDLLVPPTFWFEVTNGLWAAVRRGRLERGRAVAGLEALLGFRFETWNPHPVDCLALALDYGIAAYGAAYLQVALESASTLWTVDRQLRIAAGSADVRVEPCVPADAD